MASDNEASSCESDPNFAVICAFFEKFGSTCGLNTIDFLDLQAMLENTQEVSQVLVDLHVKLLRKARKSVSNERWERAVIKFCHGFCSQDAWEIERFGYKKARISSKLRILKELLEMQFDYNIKFKTEINRMSADELRSQPLGRDKSGHAYWFQSDENYQIRVYKEDLDEETWTLVAKDRDGLVNLITDLSDGDSKLSSDSAANEDSNSLSEKPIIDTGQVDSNTSDSKKSLEDSEDSCESKKIELMKRERELDNNDGGERDVKKFKSDVIVSETIEEPVLKVTGVGSGIDNETLNPIVGDVIEEDVFYVWGMGSGAECRTGNEGNKSDSNNTTNDNNDSTTNLDSINSNKSVLSDNNTVPKCPYKLGTIYDTKTDNKSTSASIKSPTKKSRWDVETIISDKTNNKIDEPCKSDEIDQVPKKQPMFFFGRAAFPFKSPPATMGFGISSISKVENVPEKEKIEEKKEENCIDEDKLKVEPEISEESTCNLTESIENKKQDVVSSENVQHKEELAEDKKQKDVVSSENVQHKEELAEDKKQKDVVSSEIVQNKVESDEDKKQDVVTTENTQNKIEEVNKDVVEEIQDEIRSISIDENKIGVTDTVSSKENISENLEESIKSINIADESSKDTENVQILPEKQADISNIESETPSRKLEEKTDDSSKETNLENIETVPKLNTQTETDVNLTKTNEKSTDDSKNTSIDENTEEDTLIISEEKNKKIVCETSQEVPNDPRLDESITTNLECNVSENNQEKEFETPINLEMTTKVEASSDKLDNNPVPVKEIVCKKKFAYICGTKNEDNDHRMIEQAESSKAAKQHDINLEINDLNREISTEKQSTEGLNLIVEQKTNLLPEKDSVLNKNTSELFKENTETAVDLSQKADSSSVQKVPIDLHSTSNSVKINKIQESAENKNIIDPKPILNEELSKTTHVNVEDSKVQIKKPATEMVCLKKVAYICGKNDESNILTETKDSKMNLVTNKSAIETELQPELNDSINNKESPDSTETEMEISDITVNKTVVEENLEEKVVKDDEISSEKVNENMAESKLNVDAINKIEESTQLESDSVKIQENISEKSEDLTIQTKPTISSAKENKVVVTIVDIVPATCDLPLKNEESLCIDILSPQNLKNAQLELDETEKDSIKQEENLETAVNKVDIVETENVTEVNEQKSEHHCAEETPVKDILGKSDNENKEEDAKKLQLSESDLKSGEDESNVKKLRAIRKSKDSLENVQEIDIPKTPKEEKTTEIVKNDEPIDLALDLKQTEPKSHHSSPAASPASLGSDRYDDNDMHNDEETPEKDPLTINEEESITKEEPETKKPLSLANFSMDFNEDAPVVLPAILTRALRKRGHESSTNTPDVEEEETGGKKMKLKGKRIIDVNLRKSIEMKKEQEMSSSEEETIENSVQASEAEVEGEEEPKPKPPARKKGKKGKGKRRKGKSKPPTATNAENEEADPTKVVEKKVKRDSGTKMTRILSNLGIKPDEIDDLPQVGVRQSRRLAQLRIREQSETKRAEKPKEPEKKLKSKKSEEDKDYKAEKRKRSKKEHSPLPEDEEEVETKKSKKKKKSKDPRKLFDENKPWKSSSDSSSSLEEEEEEIEEEEEEVPLELKSDHEFSPESDIEDDTEAQPLKRARTARKESDIEEVDDCPCQKCGKSDHPEWILLCDKCDNGWHCSCLRPPLLVIPEGDWYCPPCQHIKLLESLQLKLIEYDKKLNKKTIEDRRKERLAYVGISLNNVLPSRVPEVRKKRSRHSTEDHSNSSSEDEEDESGSVTGSNTESETDSDEPIYQLRQRRQAQSYKFNDYDEMIKSAIQDEMEAVKGAGNQGRGKDIATIVQAEQNEEQVEEKATVVESSVVPELKQPVVPKEEEPTEERLVYSDDDEPVRPVKKKTFGRKKHRKLNSLDISSDDDADSDEDFKGTSSESEDDDFEEEELLSDSDDYVRGNKRRKNAGPVRRSTRARVSRYDADFINDDSDSEEEEAPRRKKKRSIWDESASEESDRSWGRRKKRTNRSQNTRLTTTKKKKSKKKKKSDDSDPDAYRRKPKIKFGGLDSSDEEGGRRTRTRGKKTTYIDTLGSDSDDEPKKNTRRIESDEDEFVLNEEDDEEENVSEEDEIEEELNEDSSEDVPVKVPKIKIKKPAIPNETQTTEVKQTIENVQPKDGDDDEEEPNPIEQMNKNLEEMDENEMEKMMEEEEYANKQLQLVALQLEKEKKRKEREAKKLEEQTKEEDDPHVPKKRGRKPKEDQQPPPIQPLPPPIHHEPIVSNVAALIHNDESNDELSEPPGVSLPLFAELAANDDIKKRARNKLKKPLEETPTLVSSREPTPTSDNSQSSNIEIAAPPLPFSQSQPTPSVITRMLQSKPLQQPTNYQIGSIRPKQFATLPENEVLDENRVRTASPGGRLIPPNQFIRAPMPPYRMPMGGHYGPPRGPLPPHIYHRAMDPSPSGGGPINMADPTTLPPAGSPNKSDSPVPPYSTRSPSVGRFPPPQPTAAHTRPPLHMLMSHIGPRPSNLYVPNPNAPPYYGSYPPPPPTEDALPPTAYQSAPPPPPYIEHFPGEVGGAAATAAVAGGGGPSEDNSKSYDEETGGEFGGLVSYFSSQREDDLES